MINTFNGSGLAGVALGYNAVSPTLNTGGTSSNTNNIADGSGGLLPSLTVPQVMGLTPLWPCCNSDTIPGTNGCLTFTVTINGSVTQGTIGAIVTPPNGKSQSWMWSSPANSPLNCHAWALEFPDVMNVIFPQLTVTLTNPISSSCTVQICPKNASFYGTTVQFVKCSSVGSGSISYSPNICNQTFTLGTAPVTTQDAIGCGDCRQGNYTADIVPDDKALELPVFADPNSTGYNTSDYNTFLLLYPSGYDAINNGDFSLEHLVNGSFVKLTTITDGTFGTPFNNNLGATKWPFYSNGTTSLPSVFNPFLSIPSCSNVNYQGYFLDWRLVFNTYGAGTYRFAVNGHTYGNGTGTSYCFKSNPFCLSQFNCEQADRTIRFEAFYTGGNRGDVNQQGNYWTLDCGTNNIFWADSIRVYGFTGAATDDLQRDIIKYQNGVKYKVRDELIKKYKVWISPMPDWFHKRFAAYALMADQLYVTDNNYNNRDYTLQRFWVVADSGYDPVHLFESRYARIDGTLLLKEGQEFVFVDRC